jgi:hypothetical protein
MSRLLRFSLWGLGLFIVVVGATLFWVESQLQPEPLGRRVKGLLADAGIKGGITRIEASLNGKFSAEGIDLTLADGTKVAAASLKGEAQIFSILSGTYALDGLEIKTLDLDLSRRQSPKTETTVAPAAESKVVLPAVVLGPYAVTGRVKLADGDLVRFSMRGEVFDTRQQVDMRAGVAWPGLMVGKQQTDPRGEIILKAVFRRPLGAQGVELETLLDDLASLQLELTAKDAGPTAAGAVGLTFSATANASRPGLTLGGTLTDASDTQ